MRLSPNADRRTTGWIAAIVFGLSFACGGAAESAPIPPRTKIRLTVLQWMPTKGTYEQWGSLGGEFTVSDTGNVSVPVLGRIPVGDLDDVGFADLVAKRLQQKIGLVDPPMTTVEIVQYSPIYVVGDVAKPGEYQFNTGLTVLQTLAMAGGDLREARLFESTADITKLLGDIQELDDSIIRATAKIQRLEAEMSGSKQLLFDNQINASDPFASAILSQEQAIFAARANAVDRKAKSLVELQNLLSEEIRVLEDKIKSNDANIKSIQEQVDSTAMLVAKGALVATRQAEIERTLRSYQDDRLDITTAIMRARQSISQATRDLQALYDERQTEVTSELQSERASLVQLKVKRETSNKLMLQNLSSVGNAPRPGEEPTVTFSIMRRESGIVKEFPASETTVLLPGDVVKVSRKSPPTSSPASQQVISSGPQLSNRESQ